MEMMKTLLLLPTPPMIFIIAVLFTIHASCSYIAHAFSIDNTNKSSRIRHAGGGGRATTNTITNQAIQPSPSSSTSLQCICINCSRVTNCKAYHFVEDKHSQPHMNEDPQFTPQDGSPTIHVNIRTNRKKEGEMGRLWSEHVEQTRLAEEKFNAAATGEDEEGKNIIEGEQKQKLIGEEKYDLSVKTTYEYDVVACEDYVEDIGCWIRNMPEEIKLANPDFVPT